MAPVESPCVRQESMPAVETGGTDAEKVCAWFPLLLCVVWKHESYSEMAYVL